MELKKKASVVWGTATEVQAEDTRWLWKPYIPMGMLTLIEGDPGLGKSWLTYMIAKAVTTGSGLPGWSEKRRPEEVVFLNAEDPWPQVIVPRMDAMGVDRAKVKYLKEGELILDSAGIRAISDVLASTTAAVVFIDPLVSFLGGKMDMHRANEVRQVMAGLAAIAVKTGAAVVGVRHQRKADGKSIYKGLGSIDFTAAARSVLMVAETKVGDIRALYHIKSNVGKKGKPLAFQVLEDDKVWEDERGRVHSIPRGRFEWVEFTEDLEITETVAKQKEKVCVRPKPRDKAIEFILDFLSGGPRTAIEVHEEAGSRGIALRTLDRAKAGIAQSFQRDGEWWWELEGERAATPQSPDHLRPSNGMAKARGAAGQDGDDVQEEEGVLGEVGNGEGTGDSSVDLYERVMAEALRRARRG